jgi:hypothetical protein
MRNLAIKDSEETFDVSFYYEEDTHSVVAVFPSVTANQMTSCYVRHEGHSDCSKFYIDGLRKATPEEYDDTLNDLIHIYDYKLRIID